MTFDPSDSVFGPNDVVFIVGAGASVEAQVPAAEAMIRELEKAFDEDAESPLRHDFKDYEDLYHQIKSSICYAQGLKGVFYKDNDEFEYHIETLVRATHELERYLEHPLYPFIANWNQRFFELAGVNFEHVKGFSSKLRKQLKSWVLPHGYDTRARYYEGFKKIHQFLQYPLRVFSLNYDLCMESIAGEDFIINQGFGDDNFWNWRLMQSSIERREDQEVPPHSMFLYKMHGSIDWKMERDGRLKKIDNLDMIDPDNYRIIFGREDKMTVASADPFLYYFSQFRAALHECKLIVCVGYSFGDDHINQSIVSAIKDETTQACLLSVTYDNDETNGENAHRSYIANRLDIDVGKIEVYIKGASSFLLNEDVESVLRSAMPDEGDMPF